MLDGRRVVDRFREIEVELADGVEPAAVAPVLDSIAAAAQPGEPISKVARALGARAAAPPDVVVPDVGPASTVRDVIAWAIAGSVVRLIEHDAVVRLGEDPEGVHQARVATRCWRSHLRTFGSMLERDWRDELRAELRWLGDELGAVRDLDVLEERVRRNGSALPDDEAEGVAKATRAGAPSPCCGEERDARRRCTSPATSSCSTHSSMPRQTHGSVPRWPRPLPPTCSASSWMPPGSACAPDARSLDPTRPTQSCTTPGSGRSGYDTRRSRSCPSSASRARRFARRAEALQQVLGAHQDAVMAMRGRAARRCTPRRAWRSPPDGSPPIEASALDRSPGPTGLRRGSASGAPGRGSGGRRPTSVPPGGVVRRRGSRGPSSPSCTVPATTTGRSPRARRSRARPTRTTRSGKCARRRACGASAGPRSPRSATTTSRADRRPCATGRCTRRRAPSCRTTRWTNFGGSTRRPPPPCSPTITTVACSPSGARVRPPGGGGATREGRRPRDLVKRTTGCVRSAQGQGAG